MEYNSLIGKHIWFDDSATMDDLFDIYNRLVDMGFKGHGSYKNEFLEYLYDHLESYGNFYLQFIKHNSSLLSDKEKEPYMDYGYINDRNFPSEIIDNHKWIYYKDLLYSNQDDNYFDEINESTENLKPEVGGYLYCHTNVVMDDGFVAETKGQFYKIISIKYDELTIRCNDGSEHIFSMIPYEDYYGIWFDLVDTIDTEDMFNSLL
jgi:hypothetical protein